MKYGFVTCVQLGLSCIEAIYELGGHLDLVITLTDEQAVKKSGRIYLDKFCSYHGIELLKARNVNDDEVVKAIKSYELDWLFIIGWSQIANEAVLKAPKLGVLGMHPTLLPIGRGRAAIPWAILMGLEETGVTMFKLNSGVDTGDIVEQMSISMTSSITATELYLKINQTHVSLMKIVFPKLESGTMTFRVQDNLLATEWPGRTPKDGLINIEGSVYDADRLVRAVTRPYPGAYFFKNDRKIIVWKSKVQKSVNKNDDIYISFKDGLLLCVEWEEEILC